MRLRNFKDAVEDARGVILTFASQTVADEDCVSEVRQAIAKLDATIDGALMRARPTELDPGDRLLVELHTKELIQLWDKCGRKSQALILDMKTLFGRYIDLP